MNKHWLCLLAVALAGTAHAQKTELTADEVVVTATRFEGIGSDKPLNMTVITAEDIRHTPARTLPQLLSYQAGIGGRDLFGNNASQSRKPRDGCRLVSVELRPGPVGLPFHHRAARAPG